VLDPKRSDCEYPYKGLSGCGVGFKMLQGWCRKQGENEDMLFEYLDLLTISIGADIVPLTNENRILATMGLRILENSRRPGIGTCKIPKIGIDDYRCCFHTCTSD
jgi:single-stranded-DNA-specific exonuclease